MEQKGRAWYEDEIIEAQQTEKKGKNLIIGGLVLIVTGIILLFALRVASSYMLIAGPVLLVIGIAFKLSGSKKARAAQEILDKMTQ